jgi:hypothetical protein
VFRETVRLRNAAVAAGTLAADDPSLMVHERRLLMAGPEHNFGLSIGTYLPGARSENGNWSNAEFAAVRNRSDYQFIESGWAEKRAFLQPAPVPGVQPSAAWVAYEAALADAVAALTPAVPDVSPAAGFTPVPQPAGQVFECGRFAAVLGADGGLASLVDTTTGWEWVSPGGGSLGAFLYQTFSLEDFNDFNVEYNPGCGPPCGDFSKQGMDSAGAVNASWPPSLAGPAYYMPGGGSRGAGCQLVTQLALDPVTVALYGGMQAIWLNFTLDAGAPSAPPTVAVELQWFGKTATRLAEAAWVTFAPHVGADADAGGWRLDVMGQPVDPLDVVVNGTRHVHAVWAGAAYAAGGVNVTITSVDAPIVSPADTLHLLWYDGEDAITPDSLAGGGWAFNVYNNVWGTAFPQWYGDDARFRWLLTLESPTV